jgi:hypothetical protein
MALVTATRDVGGNSMVAGMLQSRLISLIGLHLSAEYADKHEELLSLTKESLSQKSTTLLWKWIHKTMALVESGFHTHIATGVFRMIKAQAFSENEITKSLSKIKVDEKELEEPVLILVVDSEGNRTLNISVPPAEYSERLDVIMSLLFDSVQFILQIPRTRVFITVNNDMEALVPSIADATLKTLSSLVLYAQDPKNLFGGQVFKYEGGFSANLPELIAFSRLMRVYDGRYRRHGADFEPVSQGKILKDIYVALSLTAEGNHPYVRGFIRSLIYIATGLDSPAPGHFLGSLRARHNKISDEGIFVLAGYTPFVPNIHKVLTVFHNRVKGQGQKKFTIEKIVKRSTESGLTSLEFHAALKLLLPLYNPEKHKTFVEALKITPFSVTDRRILSMYQEMHHNIDQLNSAYATFVATSKQKKGKATYGIFNRIRTLLVGACERLEYRDALGSVYPEVTDIPSPIRLSAQSFLKKKFLKNPAPQDGAGASKEPGETQAATQDPSLPKDTEMTDIADASAVKGGRPLRKERVTTKRASRKK